MWYHTTVSPHRSLVNYQLRRPLLSFLQLRMTRDGSEKKDPFAVRKTVNVVLLGLVFMLLASRTPISIVKTVLYSATDVSGAGYIPGFTGDGYVANAILYSTFAVSNFLAPWVISIVGPKYVDLTTSN